MKQETLFDIERAIECVRHYNEQKQDSEDSSLQKSVDLLKVYTSAFSERPKASLEEQQLIDRIIDTAKKFNERLRQEKSAPATISGILKELVLRAVGKYAPKPLVQHEIHIPQEQKYSQEKVFSVLQSIQRNSDDTEGRPRQLELDLFSNKALTMLLKHNQVPMTVNEALLLIHKSPLYHTFEGGTYLVSDNVIHLVQKICPLPGVEIEISGAFQRDSASRTLVQPIRSSFQLVTTIAQTGFPHPLQYMGIAYSEKLLPDCILRPSMCPKFTSFITKKRMLAKELGPLGKYYRKAQALLAKKIAFFSESDYEAMGASMQRFNEENVQMPIKMLQDEWLIKKNSHIVKNPEAVCLSILQEAQNSTLYAPFSEEKGKAIKEAANSLYMMQLSEHLGFQPKKLSLFEQEFLVSLIRQQLVFTYELEELDLHDFHAHMEQLCTNETAFFKDAAQELAVELCQYYSVRYEIGN